MNNSHNRASENLEDIISFLRESDGSSVREIAESLSIPISSAWVYININKKFFSLGWEAVKANRGIKWRRIMKLNYNKKL